MKKKGIGGFLLFDSRGYYDDYVNGIIPVPLPDKMGFMSPEWRAMVKFTMDEAARLGLRMSINLANTGGALRGPWDLGEDGPKKLVWTAVTVKGPGKLDLQLRSLPDTRFYRDAAFVAVQAKSDSSLNQTEGLNGKWREILTPGKDAEKAGRMIFINNPKDHHFEWNIPEGTWKIIRFGQTVIADTSSVDILNKEAVIRYFDKMGAKILDDAGPLAGKTLKYFYNVSWEGGEPNWTTGFEKEFKKYRGYELKDYLPVLAGMVVEDTNLSLRFMHDYFKTVSDCFLENCYKPIGDLCHRGGVQWHAENGGPWQRNAAMFREADMLSFWGSNDIPQGEYWAASLKDIQTKTNSRFTAMASHIYGKPLVALESFTHMTTHWSKYPAFLKPIADNNFIDGCNMMIWHTWTASPPEIGKPGFEYFAGTHINPRVTWWDKAGDFINYLGRCQYLLRKGQFVADICCFTSDKNYIRWGRGKQWRENSSLQLKQGYTFDLLNAEVLVNRLKYQNGNLVLPDGMNYKILVVDPEDKTMTKEALQKITELKKAGATIVLGDNKPERVPGLLRYEGSDKIVTQMADELWKSGSADEKSNIHHGLTMEKILKAKKILPDFTGPFEYIHRTSPGADIYFICGSGRGDCTFRIQGKKPQFWNAVTGEISDVMNYQSTEDGRTLIPVELPQDGSVFVVFTGIEENNHITSITGSEDGLKVRVNHGDTLQAVVWKSGNYSIKTLKNQTYTIKAEVPSSIEMNKSWEVSFTPGWGAPEKVRFEKLIAWNTHPNPGIKYFSGTAIYRSNFILTEKQTHIPAILSLGKLRDIARIKLNGKDLGILWTAPWSVDISSESRAGGRIFLK